MSLFVPFGVDWQFRVDNLAANPSDTPGTSVVPGASNAEGSWTQVLSALAQDVYWLSVAVSDGFTGAAIKKHMLDIGVDPAGGSTYTEIVPNILCSGSQAATSGTISFAVPFYIKSGSTVAVRIRGSNATAGTVRVTVVAYGQPDRPETVMKAARAAAMGVTESTVGGTAFTPGNAADGTYVSLGTLPWAAWWIQLGYHIDNTIMTAETTYIELAVGDATNKRSLMKLQHRGNTSEAHYSMFPFERMFGASRRLSSGAELWVRGRCNNAPDTGYEAAVVVFGG